MPNGKLPSITEASVRAALTMMAYTSVDKTAEAQALHMLLLVDEFLEQPSLPRMSHARTFAINHILATLITQQLTHERRTHGLEPPDPYITLEDLPRILALDAQTQAPELVGWSLLFHEHVCYSLHLQREQFAALFATDVRQLRRYYSHTLKRLTDQLIQREWQARQKYQQRRILAQLPPAAPFLVGRAAEIQHIEEVLQQESHPCIWISGLAGIGKSTLVNTIIRRQIIHDPTSIDYCIWIHNPTNITAIYDQLKQQLLMPRSQSTVEQILLTQHVWVVLDGVDASMWDDPTEWGKLLQVLGSTTLLITSRVVPTPVITAIYIALTELTHEAMSDLVYAIVQQQRWSHINLDDYVAVIWQTVGGHPLAVYQALLYLEKYGNTIFQQRTLDDLYLQEFQQFSSAERVLLVFAAIYEQGFETTLFAIFGDPAIATRVIQHGWLTHEITSGTTRYSLSATTIQFIRLRYDIDANLRQECNDFLLRLLQGYTGAYPQWIETILCQQWLQLPMELWEQIIQRWALIGVVHGKVAHWIQILTQARISPLSMGQLAYAMGLKRLGRRQESEQLLRGLIQKTGQHGQFEIQAYALLGYAGWLRESGHYEKALQCIQKADTITKHLKHAALQEQVIAQMAQIALDQQNQQQLQNYLVQLPTTETYQLLRLEMLFILQHDVLCTSLAQQILATDCSPLEQAQVYTILGRRDEQAGRYKDGLVCFENALYLYEREGDVLAGARAQSNVAALLLHDDDPLLDRAEQLLRAAYEVQTQIQDVVGLHTTQLNIRYLLQQRTIASTL